MTLNYLPVVALAATLTACNANDAATDLNTVETPEAAGKYSGVNTAATLNTENSFVFLEQVFAGSPVTDSSESATTDSLKLHDVQTALAAIALKVTPDSYATRKISETENCSASGNINVTASIDNSDTTHTLTAELDNCGNGSEVLHGKLDMTFTPAPESLQLVDYTLDIDQLLMRDNGFVYALSGNQAYNITQGVESVKSNLLLTASDETQVMTEDFMITDNLLESFYTGTTETGLDLSGKIYHSDHGYIEVYTPELLKSSTNELLPDIGTLDLVGDSSLLNLSMDHSITSILLDQDGNGDHELSAEIDKNAINWNEPPAFNVNTPE